MLAVAVKITFRHISGRYHLRAPHAHRLVRASQAIDLFGSCQGDLLLAHKVGKLS
jgi:hypothetical protein